MSDDRSKLIDVFNDALALDPSTRAAFVRERCADEATAEEVFALLRWHQETTDSPDTALSASAFGSLGAALRAVAAARPLDPAVADSGFAVGTRLGAFEILERIGAGATSVVYRARQLALAGREVALKVCSTLGLEADDVDRFRQEAAIAARLDHPNLVQVFDSGEDQERGLLFYAMRLVRGPTLAAFALQRGVAHEGDPRFLVARAHEIAKGLGALHAAGLVHRDVKPGNIVLDDDAGGMRAVLVDFGQVQSVTMAPHATRRFTPSYAAPEIVAAKLVDGRADVFGLGVTLYDLLSGQPPAAQPAQVRTRVSLGRIAPHLDTALVDLVMAAVAEDPAARPADGAAFAARLGAWLDAPRSATSFRARRRRRRLLTSIGAIGFVATLGFVGIVASRRAVRAGDLATLVQVAGWLPDSCLGWVGLDADASAVVRGMVAAHRERGEAAAVRLLGAHIARDGPERHPMLLRTLENGCAAAIDLSTYWDVAARVLLERPAQSVAEQASLARLAGLARGLLELPHAMELWGCALTVLAGCGDHVDLVALVRVAEQRASDGDEKAADDARLACRAVQAIAANQQRRGAAWPGSAAMVALVQQLERLPSASLGALAFQVEAARSGAAEALAFAARAAGDATGARDILAARAAPTPFERAAAADLVLRAELAAWLGDGPPVPTATTLLAESAPALTCYRFGLLVGAYGDDAFTQARQTQLVALCNTLAIAPALARERFAAGCAWAAAARNGIRDDLTPDPGTGLVAVELALPAALVAVPMATAQLSSADDIAQWTLTCSPALVSGEGMSIATRAARVMEDEVEIGQRYLGLGLPGRSAVELGFTATARPEVTMAVEIWAQLGARQLVRGGGDAALDVMLDDQIVQSGLRFHGTTESRLRVVIGRNVVSAPHRLRIVLSDDSTTTVRLYGVRVFCRD